MPLRCLRDIGDKVGGVNTPLISLRASDFFLTEVVLSAFSAEGKALQRSRLRSATAPVSAPGLTACVTTRGYRLRDKAREAD